MVHIPAGSFLMGTPEGKGRSNEHPQHMVTLSGYCIDKTEVTVRAYAACSDDGRCDPAPLNNHVPGKDDADVAVYDQFCNGNRGDRQNHPINCLDWNMAKTYCEAVGKRLPTEAEWEYAARGSDNRTYPWGEEPPGPRLLDACDSECLAMLKRLNTPGATPKTLFDGDDGWATTAPVGSYPDGASPFGVLDMAGNVREWVADAYGSYGSDAVTDPTGGSDDKYRVFRGGGFYIDGANAARTANRFYQPADHHRDDQGVRCARGELR
jgi:formylglycine-generating enzyme required for sulfatase activity